MAKALLELAKQARHCVQRAAIETVVVGLEEVVGGKQGALGDAMPDRCLVIVRYAGNSRRKRGHDSAQPSWAVERLPLNSPQASKRGEEGWLIVVAGGRRMKASVNR